MSRVAEPVLRALEKPGFRGLVAAAWKKFSADRASRIGAALAYYAVFALAPLLLIAVGVAGLVLSEEAAQGEVVAFLSGAVGADTAAFVESLVLGAGGGAGVGGTVVGSVLSLFAASAVTAQLQGALDTVWDVPAAERLGLIPGLRRRGKAFVIVLGSGALLLAMMAASAVLAAADAVAGSTALGLVLSIAGPFLNVGFAALTFALMFSLLPAHRVPFREAAVGGLVAAVLFSIATFGFGLYLGTGAVGRGFGAAGALVVLLVFVYYAAQVVLFGAEVARVYGIRSEPAPPLPSPLVASVDSWPAPTSAVMAFLVGVLIGRRRP